MFSFFSKIFKTLLGYTLDWFLKFQPEKSFPLTKFRLVYQAKCMFKHNCNSKYSFTELQILFFLVEKYHMFYVQTPTKYSNTISRVRRGVEPTSSCSCSLRWTSICTRKASVTCKPLLNKFKRLQSWCKPERTIFCQKNCKRHNVLIYILRNNSWWTWCRGTCILTLCRTWYCKHKQ